MHVNHAFTVGFAYTAGVFILLVTGNDHRVVIITHLLASFSDVILGKSRAWTPGIDLITC